MIMTGLTALEKNLDLERRHPVVLCEAARGANLVPLGEGCPWLG